MAIHDEPFFLPDIESLLTPIPGDLPAGPSLRYDLLHLGIRQAREEDDASLPMGVWTRPLIKADWKAVSAQCTDLLGNRSKDFQVAAWLCDAWTRLYKVEGFIAGVDLLTGLVARYWETAHPQIEDGDDDARAAPFIWLNENLPLTLMLNLTFIQLPERTPSAISLADWDRTLVLEQQQKNEDRPKPKVASAERAATRAEMTAYAEGNNLLTLVFMGDQLQLAIEKWTALAGLLDQKMTDNQPSVARVGDMLRRILHVVASLIGGRDPRSQPVGVAPASATASPLLTYEQEAAMPDTTTQEPPASVSKAVLRSGAIASREDAYRLLEAVATYLMKTEPHSPTPYLVKRAVSWGRMSLVDLMQEVVREEGDLTRYFSLLGIKKPE
ncbi:MAG: type VI secretion system protein ImpA [Rhodoferax sp.]|jgi:type VI secretion system protein ImpA